MRAVRESSYELREVPGPRRVRVCDHCDSCDPVLVRTDQRRSFGDLVHEHPLFVDFTLTLRPGEPLQVERTTGTREEFKRELAARGLYVLQDSEPPVGSIHGPTARVTPRAHAERLEDLQARTSALEPNGKARHTAAI
jgi:hypothetical protein